VHRILASTNLINWESIATVTNTAGVLEFVDPEAGAFDSRFHMAAPAEKE